MKILKSGLFVVFTGALLMSGCATQTPAPDNVASLEGTTWHYADKDWQYDLEFAPNGVLHTTHPNDKTRDNDTWEQSGETIHFYYNDKFSHYTGTVSGNNLMMGTATNKKGSSWDWKASRAE
jgi:outer membrane biogenesis lipoprotein LolB